MGNPFDELTALADKLDAAAQAGLEAGADVLQREEVRQIEPIENAEIPTSRTGRPLWERTEALPKGVEVTFPSKDSAVVDVGGAAAAYAPRRDALGVDWLPENPAGGIVRLKQFAEDTQAVAQDKAVETVAATIAEKLGL